MLIFIAKWPVKHTPLSPRGLVYTSHEWSCIASTFSRFQCFSFSTMPNAYYQTVRSMRCCREGSLTTPALFHWVQARLTSDSSADFWTCAVCTLHNAELALACTACYSVRTHWVRNCILCTYILFGYEIPKLQWSFVWINYINDQFWICFLYTLKFRITQTHEDPD